MIEISNLYKYYQNKAVKTVILDDFGLHVAAGEFVALMGPSGCGKSTLLNIIALFDEMNDGRYLLNSTDIASIKKRDRSELNRQHIGFVFQSFNLLDEMTVYENIELPLIYTKVPSKERKIRVEEILQKLHITAQKDLFPQQLSGGQQQRAAIARAIINRPKLILADEPTGNLDSNSGKEVMELLAELNKIGTTILMATHNETDAKYAHRIVRMLDGKVVNSNQE